VTERLGQQPDPARKLKPGEPRYHSLWRPRPPGSYYDRATAEAAVAFFPAFCRFTEDEWAGHPFTLEPWQAEYIIRPAFGWKRKDGTRLYRRVMIWIPRKNGKTALMGGVAHLLLLGDAVQGAECYSIASSGDQAEIVFKAAANMVAYSPELSEQYEVFEDSLFVRATMSRFEFLTGKPRGKHGLKTTYLIGDEVHEWATNRLYTFVRQAMKSRREPMEWLISTAGIEEGFGVDLWDESLKICEGTFDDPETLVLIWCAPPNIKDEDLYTERTIREANPNFGISIRPDAIAKEAREAKQSTVKENDYKRYTLNIWVGQDERWLPMPSWNACTQGGPDSWQEIADRMVGRRCFGGLDLASTKDFNALLWVFPPESEDDPDERWVLLPRFWWPKASMKLAASKSRIPFEEWAAKGAFVPTQGNTADHDAIEQQVLADMSRFKVEGLGIDLFNAHSIATSLAEQNVPVELIRFGMLSMSMPSKLLETLVLDERIDHGGHPVLRWMASNVAIRRDSSENYMPCKQASANKIDGIAAAVMALAMASRGPAQKAYQGSGDLLILPYAQNQQPQR
jgi:phage terminase large subunit-like protein